MKVSKAQSQPQLVVAAFSIGSGFTSFVLGFDNDSLDTCVRHQSTCQMVLISLRCSAWIADFELEILPLEPPGG